ncbi:MAG: hypothetical protein JWR19_1442 [Pedosphaera sp.]|nr:hypothetical protein [Pedosphaera sp.]
MNRLTFVTLYMKTIPLFLAALLFLLVAGCSTPGSVAKMEGRGTRRVFNDGYNPVWNAAIGAAQLDDLRILDSDEYAGYISVRRAMGTTTFGENISIWVRNISPTETEVEVVSRHSGPPVLPLPNGEQHFLNSIADILPG